MFGPKIVGAVLKGFGQRTSRGTGRELTGRFGAQGVREKPREKQEEKTQASKGDKKKKQKLLYKRKLRMYPGFYQAPGSKQPCTFSATFT